jgi:transcriptional regulator with XRE-family HTH domain
MNTKPSKKSGTMAFLDSLAGEPLSLGSLLQTIRETDDYTQADLARRLGVSKSHLCDIEKGRKTVSPERASKFALELGYSEEQFVRLALQQMVETAGLRFDVSLSARGAGRRSRGAA